jgi:endonuclease/exonuclease/phosphatase family metal-dependent hydrolase
MCEMTTKWRAWLAVAAVLATIFTVQAAAPAAAHTRYTFLQFNMSGHMNHLGRTEDVVPAVTNSITSSFPTAVSLNEVCENQFAQIYWNANAAGGGYNAHFAEVVPAGSGICGGHAYGLALLLRGDDPGYFSERSLPIDRNADPPREPRTLICGQTGYAGGLQRLIVCSSHLEPGDGAGGNQDWKYAQMKDIAESVLIPFADARQAVAFMGDTYLTADEMIFATKGRFAHTVRGNTKTNPDCLPTAAALQQHPGWAQACATGTLVQQADHVMVSTNRSYDVSGSITSTRVSDHLPVRGTAAIRYP